MSRTPDRQGYRIAAMVLAAGWLLLSSPWLFGDVTIPYDAKAHFHAQVQFLANSLHRGQWPFWTPFVFGGSPHIADPQSLILSPALLIALAAPSPSLAVVDVYAFALLALGGASVLMLFKDRGWHPAGAAVAALSYTFGASAAWRIQHVGQIQSYALAALALWLLVRTLERRSALWGAAAGLAAAAMIVEPDQVAYLGCFLLAAVVIDHWLVPDTKWQIKQTAAPLIVAAVVGLMVVAIPLLMTYLFVASSSRSVISFAEATRGSLHPASLLTLLFSDLYGAHDIKIDYWGPFSESWDPNEITLSQNMSQLYVGALPMLMLLGLGFSRRLLWAREVRVYSISAVLFLIYALGAHTPLYRLLYDWLPGVALFRRPADATFMLGGMLAILGGYVIHRWADGTAEPIDGRARWPAKIALGIAVLGAAFVVAASQGKLHLAIRPMLTSVVWASASLLLLAYLTRNRRLASGVGIAALGLLVTLDLAVNNGPNESTALPRKNYAMLDRTATNETIRQLKVRLAQPKGSPRRDRVELAGLGFEWPNAAMVHEIDHTLGYNPLRLADFTTAVGAEDSIIGPEQRRFTPLFPSYKCRMADLLGLRYIVTPIPVAQIDRMIGPSDLKLVARTAEGYIYENPRALPRVMFVRDWIQADFKALLKDGRWPGADPATTVLLEERPQLPPAPPMDSATTLPPPGLRMTTYENTRVDIEVDAPEPGFVVLNDVWHPWWRATINGKPVEIHKANVLFRAVAVPAGNHRLRFEFAPIAGAIEEMRNRLGWARDAQSRRR